MPAELLDRYEAGEEASQLGAEYRKDSPSVYVLLAEARVAAGRTVALPPGGRGELIVGWMLQWRQALELCNAGSGDDYTAERMGLNRASAGRLARFGERDALTLHDPDGILSTVAGLLVELPLHDPDGMLSTVAGLLVELPLDLAEICRDEFLARAATAMAHPASWPANEPQSGAIWLGNQG